MGRPLRVQLAGGFRHVLSRGNERRPVSLDDERARPQGHCRANSRREPRLYRLSSRR